MGVGESCSLIIVVEVLLPIDGMGFGRFDCRDDDDDIGAAIIIDLFSPPLSYDSFE